MGRCQSTPGLIESKGLTTLEDMWLPQTPPVKNHQTSIRQEDYTMKQVKRSLSPSTHSSDCSGSQSACSLSKLNYQNALNGSITQLGFRDGYEFDHTKSNEALECEIKSLRSRLHTVETENQVLNSKLSQQQTDLENRLAEIEIQIRGQPSVSSLDVENEIEDFECNRESII